MPAATIRQCVIPLGRFGSAAPALLSPQPCGDRPVLAWLLREFLRFGVEEFLLPSDDPVAAERVVAACATGLPREARLTVLPVPEAAGSAGALHAVQARLQERFLLCRGETLFDCNLAELLAAASQDASPLLARLLLCQATAERPGVAVLGDRVTALGPGNGPADTGVGVFSRGWLEWLPPAGSLRDGLVRLTAAGLLRATVTQGWLCDLAAPGGLAQAAAEAPRRLRRRALFLDRDGVLNIDHGWVGTRERFEWIAGAPEAVRHATQAGWHVFVVTNQSGVARGLYDEAAVHSLFTWISEQVHRNGGTLDDMRYCPYHEQAVVEAYRCAHPWRKPQPGMLLDLIRAWELQPADCHMVGDQPTDVQTAEAAGVPGHLFSGGNLLCFVQRVLAD